MEPASARVLDIPELVDLVASYLSKNDINVMQTSRHMHQMFTPAFYRDLSTFHRNSEAGRRQLVGVSRGIEGHSEEYSSCQNLEETGLGNSSKTFRSFRNRRILCDCLGCGGIGYHLVDNVALVIAIMATSVASSAVTSEATSRVSSSIVKIF
ncbi:hypothetical protein BGX30_005315 [Mortierella sp. GBA39]|nr:hypothetical protein BGX30_005315 [Mortierella sp. GBA39]